MSDRTDSSLPLSRRILFYSITVFLVAIVFVGLELAGWSLLRIKKAPTYPFLINRSSLTNKAENVLDTRFEAVDPHLGHSDAHRKDNKARWIPGFAVYEPDSSPDRGTRIIALGGSTTAANSEANWPRALYDAAKREGYRFRVFNGGVSGYSSNQELIKLIRDVLPLRPQIVLSLSGINDLGFVHSVNEHPMVTPYQKKIMEFLVSGNRTPARLFPNLIASLRLFLPERSASLRVNYGPVVKTQPWTQWIRNIRLMKAVCDESGIRFLSVLQPVMGAGKFSPTPEEEKMYKTAVTARPHYKRAVEVFYERVRPQVAEIPWCLDWTNLFENETGVYKDARHQNRKGVEIIGKAFLDQLKTRRWVFREYAEPTTVPEAEPVSREQSLSADLGRIRGEVEQCGGWTAWSRKLDPFRKVVKGILSGSTPEGDVFRGVDDFLFSKSRLTYLLASSLTATQGITASFDSTSPPVEAVVALRDLLEKKGIDLIVVPVPPRSELYYEKIHPDLRAEVPVAPHRKRFVEILLERRVETIDLLPYFLEAAGRSDPEPLYQITSPVWGRRGIRIAAEVLARRLSRYPFSAQHRTSETPFAVRTVVRRTEGFLLKGLNEIDRMTYPSPLVPLDQILSAGKPYHDVPDSPVLVIGGGYAGALSNHSAGLSAHLAYRLGFPLSLEFHGGAGPRVPQILAEKGDDYLERRQVVIWVFVARYLAPNHWQEWKPVELP